MHELSLATEVLELVETTARANNLSAVRAIQIDIGTLAGVEVDSFRFALETILEKTIAHHAIVQINTLVAQGKCLECGLSAPLLDRLDPCPKCGAWPRQAIGGTEFRVKSLDGE